jgi:hypothetical protein
MYAAIVDRGLGSARRGSMNGDRADRRILCFGHINIWRVIDPRR